MYDRKVWEAVPGHTLLHRLDIRTKLILLMVMALAAIFIDSPKSLYLLFLFTLLLHGVARTSWQRWKILILFILLGIWGSMVSQALFYSQEPRSIVACLITPAFPFIGPLTGGVFIYREGLEYGAIQALRSATMLSLGLLLTWTSDPRKLLRVFMAWKMPYELAFMFITSLRFLPIIFQETAIVLTAQKLRGFQPFQTVSPRRMIQAAFQTLIPVLSRTLRRAATLAVSVESRGFGRDFHLQGQEKWNWAEQVFSYGCLTLLIGLGILKLMYCLQYNGIFYFPAFRSVYDTMKVWM